MRLAFLCALCICFSGCIKTDLTPLPHVTRINVLTHSSNTPLHSFSKPEEVSGIVDFIERHRSKWTCTFLSESSSLLPSVRADLYDGEACLGYFAVAGSRQAAAAGATDGLFEFRRGKILARKRVSLAEADQFIDLVGVRGTTVIEL